MGNLTLDFRETFPSLPYREITSAKFEICGKQLDSNLNVVGQYLRDGAVARWRAAFVEVLSDWRFPTSDDAAGHQSHPDKNAPRNPAQMRDHEYRSVIKEYLLNRVAAPDKFQYIGLRELVHDPQLAAYRTKLNIWFQSAPHRFRKHLIGRILDETSSTHSSALSELFLYRLFSSWGWLVEPEPKDYACVPDFFVETPAGSRTALERREEMASLRTRAACSTGLARRKTPSRSGND